MNTHSKEPQAVPTAVAPQVPSLLAHNYSVSAGAFIRAELEALEMTQSELAGRTGLSTKHVNQVLQDVVPLSTDAALRIERAMGLSAELLTAIEAAHQAARGRATALGRMSEYIAWLQEFPVSTLKRLGVLGAAKPEAQVEELLTFFGVADPEAFDRYYDGALMSFRRAQHLTVKPRATAVWLRLAERHALAQDLPEFDKQAFASLVPDLPSLTLQPFATAYQHLVERCAAVGVCVVFLEDVGGARASAATRWLPAGQPVIVLSSRGKYEDSIWFSFFHECGHVLLHPKRRIVVHLDRAGDDEDGAETQANNFARSILLHGYEISSVVSLADTCDQARSLAKGLNIHPGIIGGQVAYQLGGRGFQKFSPIRRKLDVASLQGRVLSAD